MRAVSCLLLIFPFVSGCVTKEASSKVKQVSIEQLAKETDHLVFFSYIGSDAEFHYFKSVEGNRFKVLLSEWPNAQPFPLDGGMELFVTVKDGKLAVPDPKEMARLSEDQLNRPFKKK